MTQDSLLADPRASLRRIDRRNYPEVDDYSWEDIYGHGDNMAPGGLCLASRMARSLHLEQGDVVLDIACGRGDSSIFLAKRFGVRVFCFDLWIPAAFLARKIEKNGCTPQVEPLDLDATIPLPFGASHFDAMFCMQSLHSFGGNAERLRRLLGHLKPGCRFAVGGTCFNEEPSKGELPAIYRKTDGWDAEYEKYHSPAWWRALFLETRLVDVIECRELQDGLVMWEDEILHHGERAGWTEEWHHKAKWLIDQVAFSRRHSPYLTHYIATLRKRHRQRLGHGWSETARADRG